jgi:hypothetical protein
MELTRLPAEAFLRRAVREPLVHFIVLGLAVFLIGKIHGDRAAGERIVVTPQWEARIANQYALQFGVRPDPRKMSELIDADIHDEILLREGLALGLDKQDEIVRRRIIQKMQFLLEDTRPPAEPDEGQLEAYYRAHLERYALPDRVSFSHIYFSADSGEPAARRRALAAVQALPVGSERAPSLGDPFPDLYDFSSYGREQVERLFGHSEFSREVFSVAPGRWAGPFKSAYGWHLLYVQSRESQEPRPLSAVRDKVRADYLLDEQQEANDAAFQRLARKFIIVRNGQESSP